MNALLPGEPHGESTDRMTAGGDRPPAVEVLSAEKVFANGTPRSGADRSQHRRR